MAKVLLVEDDSNLREIYGARLEAEGYEIVTANDGEEGLAVAVKERPQLIIADVMMPKISGFDMLDILRTTPETKDVKVIVMTALSQDEDRQRGESLGADRYFVKSQVVLEDLVATVKELLQDVPGGQPTPSQAADISAAPTTDQPTATPASTASMPADDDSTAAPQPQTTDQATAPAEPVPLENEVADFVANSPLMNDAAAATPQPVQAEEQATDSTSSEDTIPPQPTDQPKA